MLGLGSSVREGLLDGHQELVPQGFVYKSAVKCDIKTGELSNIQYMLLRNIIEHKKAL